MLDFSADTYSAALASLIDPERLNVLGAATGNASARDQLTELSVESAFHPLRVVDHDMAKCCLSGIWLHHNYLDESHALSQDIQSASGSYWHGIMHRREGDFSNAKYWFRNAGDHPAFSNLQARLVNYFESRDTPKDVGILIRATTWDPAAFVDLCRQAQHGDAELEDACRQIARFEWQKLFDFCYHQAIS